MSADRHSKAEQKELIDDPVERARAEAQNGILQFELVLDAIRANIGSSHASFQLRPSLILRLQDAALRGIHPLAGTFRNTPVHISGSKHAPPDPFMVAEEVASLCQYVNDKWADADPIHLAAYILWKLNWIHPFADGNGRTARAVSYLVMSIKLDSVLPGTPSIPEQIAANKGPYYDALEAADAEWTATGMVNVRNLEQMLTEMLQRQLLGLPTLSETAQDQLRQVLTARVKCAPTEVLERRFGTTDLCDQLWAIADHLVLQLGPKTEIAAAEARAIELGSPFPGLLALGESVPKIQLESNDQFDDMQVELEEDAAFQLSRDGMFSARRLTVNSKDGKINWSIRGAIFVVRFGSRVTTENFYKSFDWLIARDLSF